MSRSGSRGGNIKRNNFLKLLIFCFVFVGVLVFVYSQTITIDVVHSSASNRTNPFNETIFNYLNNPVAENYGGRIYFSYINSSGNLGVAYYDSTLKNWSDSKLISSWGLNDHAVPVLHVIKNGAHAGKIILFQTNDADDYNITAFRSTNPEDISSWESFGVHDGTGNPQHLDLCELDDGKLVLAYARTDSGDDRGFISISEDAGETWTETKVFDTSSSSDWTFSHLACSEDTIHLLFENYAYSFVTQKDLYYIYSNDSGTNWYNTSGSSFSLPVNESQAEIPYPFYSQDGDQVRVFSEYSDENNFLHFLAIGGYDNTTMADGMVYNVFHNGSGWTKENITTGDALENVLNAAGATFDESNKSVVYLVKNISGVKQLQKWHRRGSDDWNFLQTEYSVTGSNEILFPKSVINATENFNILYSVSEGYSGHYFAQWGTSYLYALGNFGTEISTSNITRETDFLHLEISNETPYSNLVFYSPFDINRTALIYDYTNQSNNLNVGNSSVFAKPLWNSSGFIGGSYDFDGVSDYLSSGDPGLDGLSELSLTAWVKLTGGADTRRFIFTLDDDDAVGWGSFLEVDDSNKIKFSIQDASRSEDFSISSDETFPVDSVWHHIAVVWNRTFANSSDASIYIDGVDHTDASSYVSNSYSSSTAADIDSIGIGAETRNTIRRFFVGSIDEPMVFTKLLNSTQVSEVYSNSSNRFKSEGLRIFVDIANKQNTHANTSINGTSFEKGTSIKGSFNSSIYSEFSESGEINLSDLSDINSGTSINFSLKLISSGDSSGSFYSPLLTNSTMVINFFGDLDTTPPTLTFLSPTSGQSVTTSSLSLSIQTNENSTCNYSTDGGTTNSSLTANSTGTGHTGTLSSLSTGSYTLNVYCSDIAGNQNNSESVSFSVSIASTSTNTGSTSSPRTNSGGGSSSTFVYSSDDVKSGFSRILKKDQAVKTEIKSSDKIINIESVDSEKAVVEIDGKSYSVEVDSSTKVDLDNEGVYDLEISNSGSSTTGLGDFANLEFKEISEEVESENQEEQKENVFDKIFGSGDGAEGDKEKKISFWQHLINFLKEFWERGKRF